MGNLHPMNQSSEDREHSDRIHSENYEAYDFPRNRSSSLSSKAQSGHSRSPVGASGTAMPRSADTR